MISLLKTIHVFVIPSTIENSPNSLAEAQIMGVPCVGSNVGGISTYIENYVTGLLYNNNDQVYLANCIAELFENDDKANKISTMAREVAVKRHDKDKSVNELIYAYTTIINNFDKARNNISIF